LGERYELVDCAPRELGLRAAAGEVAAGLLPLIDYVRLEDRFERLGPFGIAVRGRARSAILFSRRPIRQLDGATIAVTEETSTTAVVLRLLLEQRYRISPAAYRRGQDLEGDALLLIGDEALRFQQANTRYPYEIDVAFEWWLWQHAPCVFAVWAIRRDAGREEKRHLETALSSALGLNTRQLELLAQERSPSLGIPADVLQAYLASFIYRLSQPEEEGISRLRALAHAHRLL
jgi:chorismate dehydratase